MDLHSVKADSFEHRSEPENGLNFRFLLELCQRLADFLALILVSEGRVKREACFEASGFLEDIFHLQFHLSLKMSLIFWTSELKSIRY